MSADSRAIRGVGTSASGSRSLEGALLAARRRVRLLLALRYVSVALLWTSALGLLFVALSKLRVIAEPDPRLIGALLLAAIAGGAAIATTRRISILDTARLTERRADLKERLSSAVEFHDLNIDPALPYYSEQYADVNRYAAEINLSALYPLRAPRQLALALFAALLLFLSFFLPTLPAFWSRQHRDEVAEVKRRGIAIVKLARDTQKTADQQKLDETKKAAAEARKLGEAMRNGRLTKKQSLLAVHKLTQRIEEAQRRLAASLPQKSLEQAHAEFKRSMDQMAQQAASERPKSSEAAMMEPKARQQGKGNPQDDHKAESPAMKQVRQAMQQMTQALANQNSAQMQAAMASIAQQMQSGQMSKSEMEQLQKALQHLANALRGSQLNLTAEQLKELAKMMQGMGAGSASSLQQMAAMMRAMGMGMGMGMGKGNMMSVAMLDMKTMDQLAAGLCRGCGLCRGNGARGNGQGGHGHGLMGGIGQSVAAMKDPGATTPRLLAMAREATSHGIGKAGSAKEFAKYLATASTPSKHQPNAKIAGTRSQNGNELQMMMTGDPEPAHSTSPYYQAYQTSKKMAEDSLNKEAIPATYKKQVHDYFDSIRP